MKYSQAVTIIAVAFAGQALSQDLSGLPQCAQAAAISGITGTGCPLTDIACICNNTAFLQSVQSAIQSTCTPAEQAQTIQFAAQLCASAGVTIPTGGASGGASSTAAESSAAETSAAETSAAETTAAETSAAETTAAETTAAETTAAETTEAPQPTEVIPPSNGTSAVVPVPIPTVPAGNGTATGGSGSPGGGAAGSATQSTIPSPTFQSGAAAKAGGVVLSVVLAGLAAFML